MPAADKKAGSAKPSGARKVISAPTMTALQTIGISSDTTGVPRNLTRANSREPTAASSVAPVPQMISTSP